jgi:putative hydrolase of the HAD superfamily
LHAQIQTFSGTIAEQSIELLADVSQTLKYLSARHRLIVMTKGAVAEQTGKIERSGLGNYFSAVGVVAEKHPQAYTDAIAKFRLSADSAWMIGNSPKSDINPALAAGLNAVYIPHGNTWILEHEEVNQPSPPRQLLIVGSFGELREHF